MKKGIELTFMMLISLFVVIGCSDDDPVSSTIKGCIDEEAINFNPEATEDDGSCEYVTVSSYTSINVINEGEEYFSFESNSGSIEMPESFDIIFGLTPLTVEIEEGSCEFFTTPSDPVIKVGEGVTISKVDANSLDDILEVPQDAVFESDNPTGNALIGSNWFDQTYTVKSEIYVIKTCSGNMGVIDISTYDMDYNAMQIANINWDYKYNNNGSSDFTNSVSQSFSTGNAYNQTRYFSFENGAVTEYDSYDIKIIGSAIWLGNNVELKIVENTSLDDVLTIENVEFNTDILMSYSTLGWYNYDNTTHLITPRDFVYISKLNDGTYKAFEIIDYYDATGSSGAYTIKWKTLD